MTQIAASDIVFVYGALRSGTTVFRLMLDSHPQIENPGEMDFLFDYLQPDASHKTGWRYDIDALKINRIFQNKDLNVADGRDGLDLLQSFLDQLRQRHAGQMLSINIHRHLDRLLAIIPKARVIHMLRDPRDVARSSVVLGWAGNLFYGVKHWIQTEREWNLGLTHAVSPDFFTMTYEDLFTHTQKVLEDVCAFFAVPYDANMLNYHVGSTYAPPDASLIQQWRRKSDPKDVAFLESRARKLMTARGYAPEMPLQTPSRIDLVKLSIGNKLYIWRQGVRRYGLFLFFGEKVTRVLRLRGTHRKIQQNINRIQQTLVK